MRQYAIGAFNRRIAVQTAKFVGFGIAADDPTTAFFCTCGSDDCNTTMRLSVEAYAEVQEKPYRFLVAPGHATRLNDVVVRREGYWIVELEPAHRLSDEGG